MEVIHGDPNPFGEEAFHAEAMMYLPHFTSFKRGSKSSIVIDWPAVAAVGEDGQSIIINDDDELTNLFKQ